MLKGIKASLSSPAGMFFATGTVIFVAEGAIMLLLGDVLDGLQSGTAAALIDTALLAVICTPVLYLTLYRPLRRQLEMLRTKEREEHALLDSIPNLVWFLDGSLRVAWANRAFEEETGWKMDTLRGKSAADVWGEAETRWFKADNHQAMKTRRTVQREYELTMGNGQHGHYLISRTPVFDEAGHPSGIVCVAHDITTATEMQNLLQATLRELEHEKAGLEQRVEARTEELRRAKTELEADIAERHRAEWRLRESNAELTAINRKLEDAQNQLLQSEKMASVGQLAAGVAHEINNPIGYVYSNLGTLGGYVEDLLGVLDAYEDAEPAISDEATRERLRQARKEADLAFLREDLVALMGESREGIERVKKIVQDLKDFSRVDASDEWQVVDLHKGLDSTLNIVWNELKYKADVSKEYGDLPEVECLPSQLNQVFLNMLVNAGHAIKEKGMITLRTGRDGEKVWVEIADNGHGIAPEHLPRIFDPFFTTKPVGKGTGLGLSLSYSIVKKHGGHVDVKSVPGTGTTFRITLPIHHPATDENMNDEAVPATEAT